ncbi:hypothetical protein EX895_003705 [Sporisorium graminicola]|uniref:Uncharacterized protein n=1 Tax=Sporisorium graminicola TaxID=280036 RepID=A0A4U7KUL6_9BASI|nr:hypothetical protein EX895_003705 [Sporisorium graminicola]TKY87028.1 hypothetical protein EX895_003705 [Sporisorium graminicola]
MRLAPGLLALTVGVPLFRASLALPTPMMEGEGLEELVDTVRLFGESSAEVLDSFDADAAGRRLGDSPISGVVTEPYARVRLGIAATERFQSFGRHPMPVERARHAEELLQSMHGPDYDGRPPRRVADDEKEGGDLSRGEWTPHETAPSTPRPLPSARDNAIELSPTSEQIERIREQLHEDRRKTPRAKWPLKIPQALRRVLPGGGSSYAASGDLSKLQWWAKAKQRD